MRLLRAHMRKEAGSMPIALLAAIIVAGIVTVLTARTVAGERATRFDRSFTESFHTADAGVQQAVFRLNAGYYDEVSGTEPLHSGQTSTETTTSFGDDTYSWTVTRDGARSWTVTSTGTQNGVARTLQASITENPLFFPGAFGDTLVAFNGNSTSVNSYNSGNCATPAEACKWGTHDTYGTGNGALGTNGSFDFNGTVEFRPGNAFLYDWKDNPGTGVTTTDPFGDRCDGSRCTANDVRTIDDALDYASDASMKFILDALARADTDGDGQCDGVVDGVSQELGDKEYRRAGSGNSGSPPTLAPFEADSSWAVTDPTSEDFVNYYCADSLTFTHDTDLSSLASSGKPVVVFVRDYAVVKAQVTVACKQSNGTPCSSAQTSVTQLRGSDTRPAASRLQLFVAAGERSSGVKGSNITYGANSLFAGVIYAPRSRCGGPGGATVDIFGAIICGSMDNVGAWQLHYDDQLGTYGTGVFGVGHYTEEPSLNP